MANIDIVTTTTKKIAPLRKRIVLNAGQKLSDDVELLAYATKTVPEGYRVMVDVSINVMQIEEI